MNVRDVMTTEVATVAIEASIKDVGRLLSEREVSGVPVVDRDRRLRGVVTEADVVAMMRPEKKRGVIGRLLHRAPKTEPRTAGEAMTSPGITVGPRRPRLARSRPDGRARPDSAPRCRGRPTRWDRLTR